MINHNYIFRIFFHSFPLKYHVFHVYQNVQIKFQNSSQTHINIKNIIFIYFQQLAHELLIKYQIFRETTFHVHPFS
ncbi:hypothetical protein HanRHA438_Chr04g0177791 [Helianthus annuus]|nr:hypothetical protein HanRHA438_Chr04g0177791 [Helianthus annuus]